LTNFDNETWWSLTLHQHIFVNKNGSRKHGDCVTKNHVVGFIKV